jgi:hypothetical protein
VKRALLLLAVNACSAHSLGCGQDLLTRWNRFAEDANFYVHGLQKGVVDVRTRGRLDREWRAVTSCECW